MPNEAPCGRCHKNFPASFLERLGGACVPCLAKFVMADEAEEEEREEVEDGESSSDSV